MTQLEANESYSKLLHDSAAEWGLAVLPGRPLIDDDTDPYPNPTPVETLEWHGPSRSHRKAALTLVTMHRQWSYCMTVYEDNHGLSFSPWRKFCSPYPTRLAALRAASERIKRRFSPGHDLVAWLDGLTAPVQMGLF